MVSSMYVNTEDRFDSLLNDIIYRNQRYRYGNVDSQLSTIEHNLDALKADPYRLKIYKENLIPHLEQLDYQLKRLVA